MFNTSKYKTKADSYLASLVELYRIMTRYIGHVNPAVEPRSTTLTVSILHLSDRLCETLIAMPGVGAHRHPESLRRRPRCMGSHSRGAMR